METLLSVQEVANIMHVVPCTVRRWASQGLIPARKPRGTKRILFDLTDIRAFMRREKVPAQATLDGANKDVEGFFRDHEIALQQKKELRRQNAPQAERKKESVSPPRTVP